MVMVVKVSQQCLMIEFAKIWNGKMVSYLSLFQNGKKADLSTFEDLILKFPHLGEVIFNKLDDQSVIECVELNEI